MGISGKTIYDKTERSLPDSPAAISTIEGAAAVVLNRYRIIRFRGSVMIEVQEPYERFVPMNKEMFEQIAYPLLDGMPRSRMNDTFAYLNGIAEDLTDYGRYILFGVGASRQTVWDMDELKMRTDIFPGNCVWRSPFPVKGSVTDRNDKPIPFVLSIAGGDMGLYSDIMQSLAPLLMAKKPDGVIWWAGDGANGKAALMDALNKVFPGQLSSLTIKQLVGGRSNTLSLNGVLGNVAEDSNGQVTDTEIYKSIGAHQNFRMHRYHGQDGIEVQGNIHHIFSASRAPTFYTKSLSVDWRTHTIPFSNWLGDNQELSLPNDLLGQLIAEMCKYTTRIKQQGYRYEWSVVTYNTESKAGSALSRSGLALPEFRW